MIDQKIFNKEFKRICLLISQNPLKETAEQFYSELKNHELSDFLQACKDREMFKELIRLKLNIITLEDFIIKYRAIREERESVEKNKKFNEDAKAFFKRQDIPDEVREFLRGLRER